MKRTEEVRKMLRTVADNPDVLRRLLTSQAPEETRQILSESKVLPPNYPEFTPKEVAEEIERIFRDDGFMVHIRAPNARAVEWVGAIGTAAAGAVAAI